MMKMRLQKKFYVTEWFQMCVLVFAFVPVFVTSLPHEHVQDGTEYCEWESFNASCASDEVIVMTFARYGRMRTGHCLPKEYTEQPCSSDVTSEFHKQCSGRNKCVVRVMSLHRWECGSKMYRSFLEAAYECKKAANTQIYSCANTSTVKLPVVESGILASTYVPHDGPASETCSLVIQTLPYQRINLTVIDFSVAKGSDKNSPDLGLLEGECRQYASVMEDIRNDTSTNMEICGEKGRDNTVYVSQTNTLIVQFNYTTARLTHFLLTYQAIGCPPLIAPPNAWISQSTGQTISIKCNKTDQAWHLTCHGVNWIGVIGNCSSNGFDQHQEPGWSIEDVFTNSSRYPLGVLIVVGLGVAIGVAIGVLLLVIIITYMRRRHQRRFRTRFSTSPLDNKAKYSCQSFSSLARQQSMPLSLTGSTCVSSCPWTRSRPLPDPFASTGTYFRNGTSSVGSISTPINSLESTLLSPCRQGFDGQTPCEAIFSNNPTGFSTIGRMTRNVPEVGHQDGPLTAWQSDSCILGDTVKPDANPYYFKLDPVLMRKQEEWHSQISNCALCVASCTLNRTISRSNRATNAVQQS